MNASLEYIGHIETPYASLDECPRNVDPSGPMCTLVLKAPFRPALCGLHEGQQILILYWLDRGERGRLQQRLPEEVEQERPLRGTFALRSPHRPNPIGAAVLPIESIQGRRVEVPGLDCLDGTPLLDIKPAIGAEQRGLEPA